MAELGADEHLALMDGLEISHSVLSISTPGVHFGDDAAARDLDRRTNRVIAEQVARHPDRFGTFASLTPPDVHGAIEEARYGLDQLGAVGVTVLSNAHGLYLEIHGWLRSGPTDGPRGIPAEMSRASR